MFPYLKGLQAIDPTIITNTKPLRNKIVEAFCEGLELIRVVIYRATQRTFQPQLQNFSLENLLYFFPKQSALKRFLIFSQKTFSKLQEIKLFLKKTFFLYSGKGNLEPWYIQNQKYIQNRRHIQNTVEHIRWHDLQKQLASALSSFSP